MANSTVKRRRTGFESEAGVDKPAFDVIAWGTFAKIQSQYNKYMEYTLDESERFHIQCQAYSVVRAKCR
jgi:hypothetical protein